MKGFYGMGEGFGRFTCKLLAKTNRRRGGAAFFYDLTMRMAIAWNIKLELVLKTFVYFSTMNDTRINGLLSPRPDFVVQTGLS